MMLKLKLQYFGHPMWRIDSLEEILMLGGIGGRRRRGQEEKGTTEDEMAGWHHGLDGRESEWTPGDGDEQGGLACCDSWGRKESDTTERLNWTELNWTEACSAMNLPLSTALTVSHRFWVVLFSFWFISMHILISFFISSVICWLFSSVLFSLHMLTFLIVFFFLFSLHLILPHCN